MRHLDYWFDLLVLAFWILGVLGWYLYGIVW